jgi:hypothetical protein
MERVVDGAEWLRRGGGHELYGGSSGDMRNYTTDGDTNGREFSVYSDLEQRDGGNI